jgi:hypothetical protein
MSSILFQFEALKDHDHMQDVLGEMKDLPEKHFKQNIMDSLTSKYLMLSL